MALNCQNLLQFNDLCRRILFNYEMSHKIIELIYTNSEDIFLANNM